MLYPNRLFFCHFDSISLNDLKAKDFSQSFGKYEQKFFFFIYIDNFIFKKLNVLQTLQGRIYQILISFVYSHQILNSTLCYLQLKHIFPLSHKRNTKQKSYKIIKSLCPSLNNGIMVQKQFSNDPQDKILVYWKCSFL